MIAARRRGRLDPRCAACYKGFMATYTCSSCGMSVNMTCAKCGAELAHDNLDKGDGSSVAIAKCPNGDGKVKSPLCCGQDMACKL